ncbi:hypothetical protein BDY19DRAFT_1059116 [Irpex rosettiformis]|uniref:Uncharacterized protein n=1 Tax=Irpex rosettiformis TaxID=378272 RepID=A0ACB8TW34_9APHY|nr:hypothetical protein BDY19DRAFT_1059116 [Irpex rosettiformis]
MTMSISATSPSSSPAPQSPQSSNGPSTPVSPSQVQTLSLPPPSDPMSVQSDASAQPYSNANSTTGGQTQKRKPSRRANTAERRATHNAVERARRETLNGRFLDLAALLPNLSQIRRPSKSSIVNSSIAHIHASRRHRLLAARELRLLKFESDALRRELNEWRDRAGIPRIEEPVRGEGFQIIMSGEVEILSAGPIEEEEAGEDEYGDEEGGAGVSYPVSTSNIPDDPPFAHNVHHPHPHAHPHAHHLPGHGLHLQTMLPRPHGPMIVHSPQTVSFENPAMASMYDSPHMGQYFSSSVNDSPNQKWSGMPFGGQQQYTPPQSSHGYNGMYTGQRGYTQQRYAQDNDDGSSVGSAGQQSPVPAGVGMGMVKRERSGSIGSVGSSGQEMLGGVGAMGRRQQQQQQQWTGEEGYGMGMGGMGGGSLSGMGMGGRGASAALAVGGGNVFGAMML